MTQPPMNGQGPQPREVWAAGAAPSVDLYRVLGIDPRTDAAVIRGNLNNRLTIDQQARRAGRPSDPNIQLVQLAINVIGDVDVKRLYDEAMTRSTDGTVYVAEVERLASLHTTPEGRREAAGGRVPNKPARRNPVLIGTATFIAAMVAVLLLVLATSCGDDDEPAADRGSGPVSTATDGQKYSLSDVVDGTAELETVRTIDLAAVVPDAASFAESAQTTEFLARGADGTLTVAWIPTADSYNVVRVDVSGDTVTVVEQKSLSRTAWYDAANAAKADGTRSRNIRGAGEMSEAVELADGRIFAFAKGYGGKIYELKAVAK